MDKYNRYEWKLIYDEGRETNMIVCHETGVGILCDGIILCKNEFKLYSKKQYVGELQKHTNVVPDELVVSLD